MTFDTLGSPRLNNYTDEVCFPDVCLCGESTSSGFLWGLCMSEGAESLLSSLGGTATCPGCCFCLLCRPLLFQMSAKCCFSSHSCWVMTLTPMSSLILHSSKSQIPVFRFRLSSKLKNYFMQLPNGRFCWIFLSQNPHFPSSLPICFSSRVLCLK